MSLLSQWIGVVGAPVVWLLFLQINYALVPAACVSENKTFLGVVTAIALLGTFGAVLAAWRAWNRAGATAQTEDGGVTGRSRFLALSGLGLSVLFFLVVLASAIPIIFLGPCD
jgi:hypothetical protein